VNGVVDGVNGNGGGVEGVVGVVCSAAESPVGWGAAGSVEEPVDVV
jgi:hypothetical protein